MEGGGAPEGMQRRRGARHPIPRSPPPDVRGAAEQHLETTRESRKRPKYIKICPNERLREKIRSDPAPTTSRGHVSGLFPELPPAGQPF